MRRVLTTLALGLCLAGCGVVNVPLPTRDTGRAWDGGCVLMSQIVDVIADPTSGTPIDAATGEPFTWPEGFTARRALFEVEVLDPTGKVMLTTGGRYDLCPHEYLDGWVIGNASPCPDCELGSFLR